jgi:hypothetical protein
MTDAEQIKNLETRLKAAVVMLGRVLPTWQGKPIKPLDVSDACELLGREGWVAPAKESK